MGALEALREIVERNHFVILDTESTGLDRDAQICQIAVIDQGGQVLIDSLVKPTIRIPADAIAIHGITNEMVANAPTFDVVAGRLEKTLVGRDLIIYNAHFDLDMIWQSLKPHSLAQTGLKPTAIYKPDWLYRSSPGCACVCAMTAYAKYWGEWSNYYHCYRWQSLSAACEQQGIPVEAAHSALGDCRMTLALVKKICANPDDAMPECDWLSEE